MKIVLCANRHQASGKHIIYGLWFRVWTFFFLLVLLSSFSFLSFPSYSSSLFAFVPFFWNFSVRDFFFLLVTFSIKHPYMNMHTYVYECSNTGWILIEFQHSTLVILIRYSYFFFCFNAVQFLCEYYTFLYERYVNWKTGKIFTSCSMYEWIDDRMWYWKLSSHY